MSTTTKPPASHTEPLDLSLPELPVKPRLRPGVAWALDNGSVVIHGLGAPRYFRGRHASGLLPALLAAMTGQLGHEELAQAAGCSTVVLRKALRQLDSCGVLEDLADSAEDLDTPLSDWYSRATAETGRYASGRAVLKFLRTQVVHLVGSGYLHGRVAALLEAHGVAVHTSGVTDLDNVHQAALMVAVLPRHETQVLAAIDDAVASAKSRWLLVSESGTDIRLGPFFDRRLFPCLACASRAWSEESTQLPGLPSQGNGPAQGLEDEIVADFLAASVAAEVLALVAGVGSPSTVRQALRLATADSRVKAWSISPAADCPTCVKGGGAEYSGESSGYVYEFGVAGLPESLHGGRAQYGHYTQANQLSQVPRRLCANESALWSTDPTETSASSPLARPWARLSSLLTDVYGLRPGTLRRYPPTGGNIGSPRALVWLPGAVWGDRAGLHSYEPHIDALCRIDVPHQLAERLNALTTGATCILQVVDIETLENKYGPRALRIGWLDAGVTFQQLVMVCESQSIAMRMVPADRAAQVFSAAPQLSRRVLLSGVIELPSIHTEVG
ncbi:hypothetical protein [Streptomyces sp. NPDC059552]|uniref:hypothetical protein n=1 Tax=Streptomyces sp. NPDC059552 TaxID=3346862 RepID=UPI0036AABF22